jgi:hypothetical protein
MPKKITKKTHCGRSRKSCHRKQARRSHSKKHYKPAQQRGGSPASKFVTDYVNQTEHADNMVAYTTRMDLPNFEQKGGSPASKMLNNNMKRGASMNNYKPEGLGNVEQQGGSAASDRLMSFVNIDRTNTAFNNTRMVPEDSAIQMKPEVYEISGGAVSKKSQKKKRTMQMMQPVEQAGGASGFWSSVAGCGPVNYPNAGRQYAGHFSKTSSCPGPEFYANPPGLGSAGSGYDMELPTGAPFPFI